MVKWKGWTKNSLDCSGLTVTATNLTGVDISCGPSTHRTPYRNQSQVPAVNEWLQRSEETWNHTHIHMQRAIQRQEIQASQLSFQDLGRSMVDCLKWRDIQIDNKFKSLIPLKSTPIHPNQSSIPPPSVSQVTNQTSQVQPSYTQLSGSGNISAVPPVKIEFPNFDSSEEDDPVAFIERCEEYLAIRPLSEYEILASLTSILKNTAKDWWVGFLERKGAKESIQGFAFFYYRALCLKWKKDMSEKEILQ